MEWLTYLTERYPPLAYITLISGLCASGTFLGEGTTFSFCYSFFLLFLFSFYVRLKNDWKDKERDQIAFPQRAIPRGLIPKEDVKNLLTACSILLFASTLATVCWFTPWATFLWILLLLYLFIPTDTMKLSLFVTTLIKHSFILPLTLFPLALGEKFALSLENISFSLLIFFSFFTYQIVRKLDPGHHPITPTLVQFYGFKKIFLILTALLSLSLSFAWILGLEQILWPLDILLFLSLLILFKKPQAFYISQWLAILSLYLHFWSGVIIPILS